MWQHFVLLGVTLFGFVYGYPPYQDKIPNGHNVGHPCKENYMWKGVGHFRMGGGGPRNPFGQDFASARQKWTTDLCNKDSDQDGRSNGEELGDPDCKWTPGATPQTTVNITHPGICEPVNSKECRLKQTYECGAEYNCSYTKEPDVKELDLRFPRTLVPSKETTYICDAFKIPDDKVYHAIAFEPLINNSNVMHHIVIYACTDEEKPKMEPHLCTMSNCRNYVSLWTVGLDGYCLRHNVGFKFGKGSFNRISLEFHWNNPEKVSNYYDSSGIKMYYTDKLRQYEEGTIFYGQQYIALPPNSISSVEATCPANCSRKMIKQPLNITSVLMHMHYLGYSGKTEQYRDGKLVRVLANDEVYSYETPVVHKYEPPVELLPGDEIRTLCKFNTRDGKRQRSQTTWYGQGTQEEMCFSFLMYYPKQPNGGTEACIQVAEFDPCPDGYHIGPCDQGEFHSLMMTTKNNSDFIEHCTKRNTCSQKCRRVLEPLYNNECLKNSKIGNIYRKVFLPYYGDTALSSDMILACDGIEPFSDKTSGHAKIMVMGLHVLFTCLGVYVFLI